VARDAAAWPDGRRWLVHPKEGERPRVGQCWAAKAEWAGELWWAETSRWAIIVDEDNGLQKWFSNLIKAFGFKNQGFKYF
jgi:hypothetical protein